MAAMVLVNPLEIFNVKKVAANLSGRPEEIAQDESFWFNVQQAFSVDRSLVNLNSGGVSPSPAGVQDAMKRYLDYSNTAPVYSMWRILEPQREGVRKRLARFFGCDPEEVALTRNASEGLQICQFGFDLNPGDEVLTTNQDYPRMITTWQQRERREKIVLKQFSIPVPAENEDEIVDIFRKSITNKTRLILMCHMINLSGQLLPVKKIVNMAREKEIPVIVDGAHSFAHIEFKLKDLDCDYYTTSLHKCLYAPHGTGFLYVKKEKIKRLWPMMAATESMEANIRKFEEIGTHPAANYLAIADALTFNEGIGMKRKEARLRYLRDYWVKKLQSFEEIQLHTSLKTQFSCGIANVQIRGIESGALTQYLWKNYRIIVTTIKHPEFEGIRVSPNLFTTLEELDRFISAMKGAIKEGIDL
jgi:selenocysteine lyase/cysteine desulfurase